jgi:starch phosphorylase
VGPDNFFQFGLASDEVADLNAHGYRPRAPYESNPELREALDQITSGVFSRGDPSFFGPLIETLLDRDDYFVLADYAAYLSCQDAINRCYRDAARWTRMSILNVARTGHFSSDRAIREYSQKIWGAAPVRIDL